MGATTSATGGRRYGRLGRSLAATDVGVELHFRVLPQSSPFLIDEAAFRDRSRLAEVAGVEARVLAPSDSLFLTALHLAYAHRYRWYPLRSLADMLSIANGPWLEVDWRLFLETVKRSGAAGAVYWPLRLCRDWLSASIPGFVLDALAPRAPIRHLVAAIATPRYFLAVDAPAGTGNAVLYNLLLGLSLHTGCSTMRQVNALLEGAFPPPDAVGHLPSDVVRSRVRYGLYLSRPVRFCRGLIALGRLLVQVPRS